MILNLDTAPSQKEYSTGEASEDIASEFKSTLRKIENGTHYDDKYNLDWTINKQYGEMSS